MVQVGGERLGSVELCCDYRVMYSSVVKLPQLYLAHVISHIFDFIRSDPCT